MHWLEEGEASGGGDGRRLGARGGGEPAPRAANGVPACPTPRPTNTPGRAPRLPPPREPRPGGGGRGPAAGGGGGGSRPRGGDRRWWGGDTRERSGG
jgi:hypothetical protein